MSRPAFAGEPDDRTREVARRLTEARAALTERKSEAAAEAARLETMGVPLIVVSQWLGVTRDTLRAWRRNRTSG